MELFYGPQHIVGTQSTVVGRLIRSLIPYFILLLFAYVFLAFVPGALMCSP